MQQSLVSLQHNSMPCEKHVFGRFILREWRRCQPGLRGQSQNLKTHQQSPNVWLKSGSTLWRWKGEASTRAHRYHVGWYPIYPMQTCPKAACRLYHLRSTQVVFNLLQTTKRVDDLEACLQGFSLRGSKITDKKKNGVKKRVQSSPCLPGFPVLTEALRFKRQRRAERGGPSPCPPP